MSEKYENTYVEDHGDHRHVRRATIDKGIESRRNARQIVMFFRVLFGVLIGTIGLRFFLKLIGANPGNIFTEAIYLVTDFFVWPFFGIKGTPSVDGFVFDFPALIAMIVYALAAWAIIRLVWVIFYR